jgi:tRNA nucleotidyltransferase (CCA-adding enzyme)
MEDYLNKGKEILKILISNGYEAYFIGEAVRNTILNLPLREIEINTSATPEAIKGIFNFTKVEDFKEGIVKLMYYSHIFYISTFRLEVYKDKRTPVKIHYSKNLIDDLSSRDFTINAISMSHSGKVTDVYNGYEDIKKRKIRTIGKARVRFSEEPNRILMAIRFVSELNFKLANETRRALKRRVKLLHDVDPNEIAFEIKRIVEGEHSKKALELMLALRLHRHIPSITKICKFQDRKFHKFTYPQFLLVASILNGEVDESFVNQLDNIDAFRKTYQLAIANPKTFYSRLDLFINGEQICIDANYANHILKKCKKKSKKISIEYRELPIKKVCDLAFKGEDIIKLIGNNEDNNIQIIIDQIIFKILEGELQNEYDTIKPFVINLLRDMNIEVLGQDIQYEYRDQRSQEKRIVMEDDEMADLNNNLEYGNLVNATNEEEIAESLRKQGQVIKDYTEHRLDMLERRINEQDRIIREKDMKYATLERDSRKRKVQEDIENLVKKNLELLKDMKYLDNPHKDKLELSRQLNKVYMEFIVDMEDKYTNNEVKDEEN